MHGIHIFNNIFYIFFSFVIVYLKITKCDLSWTEPELDENLAKSILRFTEAVYIKNGNTFAQFFVLYNIPWAEFVIIKFKKFTQYYPL